MGPSVPQLGSEVGSGIRAGDPGGPDWDLPGRAYETFTRAPPGAHGAEKPEKVGFLTKMGR